MNLQTSLFTITYTFSTQGENHKGNKKVGMDREGFKESFFSNLEGKVYDLSCEAKETQGMKAFLAVCKDFCKDMEKDLRKEAMSLFWDRHFYNVRTSAVLNKAARANTIFCYPEALSEYKGPEYPDLTQNNKDAQEMLDEINNIKKSNQELFKKLESFKKVSDKNSYVESLDKKTQDIVEKHDDLVSDLKKLLNGIEAVTGALAYIKKNNLEKHILEYPNYLNTKGGTIYNIETLPHLDKLCKRVFDFCEKNGYKFEKKAFIVEGNLYFNPEETYIGFHGDTERRLVFGVRLGSVDLPLYYGWWHKSKLIENSLKCFLVSSGSAYIMSEKAVGVDWESPSKVTLRHAAGDFLTLLKEKALATIMNNDPYFLHKVLDDNKNFITYVSKEEKNYVIARLRNLFIDKNLLSDRKVSAERTLLDAYTNLSKSYQ